MRKKRASVKIGTSGYQYEHWKGIFYPDSLPKTQWFDFYAQYFGTVELNNTFYNLPKEKTFDDWFNNAPDGFCFALKYSRYGTHMKRLKDPEGHISLFLHHARHLKTKLGPVLVQLPPNWNANPERAAAFLEQAPSTQRWAFEFRDSSWLCDEMYAVLRQYNAALVIHDMLDNHPARITADWVYLRFHGNNYSGNYSEQKLSAVARKVKEYLEDGLDVYVYFNNDMAGCAVQDALDLKRYCTDH